MSSARSAVRMKHGGRAEKATALHKQRAKRGANDAWRVEAVQAAVIANVHGGTNTYFNNPSGGCLTQRSLRKNHE